VIRIKLTIEASISDQVAENLCLGKVRIRDVVRAVTEVPDCFVHTYKAEHINLEQKGGFESGKDNLPT